MILAEKVFGLVSSPAKRAQQRIGKHRISYQTGEHEEETVASFLQRKDVQHALSHVSHRRKVHLQTTAIQGRDGKSSNFWTLKQGKKRFIFGKEEGIDLSGNLSEEQQKKRLSMTLVVSRQVMQEKGLLPPEGQHFRKFGNRRETRQFLQTVEQEGYFATRGDPYNAHSFENDARFIQPIPAVVVKDHAPHGDNILFSVRGSANHDERLQGLIVAPFTMGHSDVGDFGRFRKFLRHGMSHALIREAAEETAFGKKGQEKPFHVFPRHGDHDYRVTVPGILRLKRFYRLDPLGVVYREEQDVDKVHAGVIYTATPRTRNVEFRLNGSSKETHQVVSMSIEQYRNAVNQQSFEAASWNKPITDAIAAQPTTHAQSSRLRRTFHAILKV